MTTLTLTDFEAEFIVAVRALPPVRPARDRSFRDRAVTHGTRHAPVKSAER